jgi:DNA repair exonuclease SbcCD ATPase subunit
MTQIKVNLTNIRLIKELEVDMISGNLYYIKGGNQKGKTTLTNAITSLLDGNINRNMLTSGEQTGEISGTIIGADDKPYKVIINLKNEKAPSFTIINPKMGKSTRKGDLQPIFGYNNVTVETFMGWGLTPTGRKKQAEMFTNLLPADARKRLQQIDDAINETTGADYLERRNLGQQIEVMKETHASPTEQEIKLAEKLSSWQQSIVQMEENFAVGKRLMSTYEKELSDHEYKKRSTLANKSRLEDEIARLTRELATVNETLEIIDKEAPKKPSVTQEALDTLESQIIKGREAITNAVIANNKIQSYEIIKTSLETKQTRYKELTEKIKKEKDEKIVLIQKNLNIPNVSIEAGELLYEDETGKYPVNEESISYSRGAMIVIDLLKRLNPEYPILCLGKSSQFDMKTINIFADIAEKEDAIIILDYVTPDPDQDLTIECFEKTI